MGHSWFITELTQRHGWVRDNWVSQETLIDTHQTITSSFTAHNITTCQQQHHRYRVAPVSLPILTLQRWGQAHGVQLKTNKHMVWRQTTTWCTTKISMIYNWKIQAYNWCILENYKHILCAITIQSYWVQEDKQLHVDNRKVKHIWYTWKIQAHGVLKNRNTWYNLKCNHRVYYLKIQNAHGVQLNNINTTYSWKMQAHGTQLRHSRTLCTIEKKNQGV